MELTSVEVLTANIFEKMWRVLKPGNWKAITPASSLLADIFRLKSYLIVFHDRKFPESLQSSYKKYHFFVQPICTRLCHDKYNTNLFDPAESESAHDRLSLLCDSTLVRAAQLDILKLQNHPTENIQSRVQPYYSKLFMPSVA